MVFPVLASVFELLTCMVFPFWLLSSNF